MAQMDLGGFKMTRSDRSFEASLAPLLRQYCSEMRVWFPRLREDFTYPPEKIWKIGTDVYLAHLEERPVGFALVGSAQSHVDDPYTKDMIEFFVTTRVRREGIGRAMAESLWQRYPGRWLVRVLQRNMPAMQFWAAAIAKYPCEQRCEDQRSVSGDVWTYFTFDTPNQH